MNIYTALQIGEYHINHCEDYFFTGDAGYNKTVYAVMDGCTMGTDSYFAATLTGKILRKIVKENHYRELYEPNAEKDLETCLEDIMRRLFRELKSAKNQLLLDNNELLTTLIIMLADQKTNSAILLAIGDGMVCINGTITDFDQNNKPDYLGFHLDEDFDDWYAQQQQKISTDHIDDISIATDGILMFKPVNLSERSLEIDPVHFLLKDNAGADKEDMLLLKLKRLEHHFDLKPTDDLAIIRIINHS